MTISVKPILFTCFLLAACSPSEQAPQVSTTQPAVQPEVMEKWSRSCVLCHVNGEGGAPKIGHPQDWQPRLDQGNALLLQHTLDGYNNMPPLGYCMSCEIEDFEALIAFMAGKSS